ncbi:hypothetical protein Tco_1282228 [Tanacetum coccineum]
MSQDVLLTVMNSMSLNNDYVNMEIQKCESCEKCLNLDAELSKSKQAYNDFLKNYSQLEKHCISLEVSMQLKQEVFQNDESCVSQNAVEIPEYFEINDLKARLQDKDKTICKLKDTIKSLRENTKEQNVFKDQFDSIKQTRVRHKEQSDSLINKLNLKSVENEDLKAQIQDKVFVITSLKNDLRKLKGKEIVENVVHTPSATTIAPGMFKLDLVPLPPRLLQNRDAHIDYLRHTQEQANTLREIVKQAKAKQPLDSELDFACKYATRIQELLVYVQDTCPNAITPSTKKVAVSPMNNVKKVRFAEPFTSSSNIKQVESSNTSDSNTPVLSSTGVKCSTSNCGSKTPGNKNNDRISQTPSRNKKHRQIAQPLEETGCQIVVVMYWTLDVRETHDSESFSVSGKDYGVWSDYQTGETLLSQGDLLLCGGAYGHNLFSVVPDYVVNGGCLDVAFHEKPLLCSFTMLERHLRTCLHDSIIVLRTMSGGIWAHCAIISSSNFGDLYIGRRAISSISGRRLYAQASLYAYSPDLYYAHGVYEESFSRHAAWIGGKLIQLMHTTMVPEQVKRMKIQAGVQIGSNKPISTNARVVTGVRLVKCIILDDVEIKVRILKKWTKTKAKQTKPSTGMERVRENESNGALRFYWASPPNGVALWKCILKGPYTPTIVTTPAVPATESSPTVPEQTIVETQTAQEMWEAIERLQQGESLNIQDVKTNLFWEFGQFTSHDGETIESYYTRFYKMMNEMIRNNLTVATMQVNVQFIQQLQPEWSRFVTIFKQQHKLDEVSYHKQL